MLKHEITPDVIDTVTGKGFVVADLTYDPFNCLPSACNPNDVIFLCSHCFEHAVRTNLYDEDFEACIERLHCDCGDNKTLIDRSSGGEVAWCYDELGIFRLTNIAERINNRPGIRTKIRQSYPDVYFAPDPSDKDFAFLLVTFPAVDDIWVKYTMFRFGVNDWGQLKFSQVTPHYLEPLYKVVLRQVSGEIPIRTETLNATYNAYIHADSSLYRVDERGWGAVHAMSRFAVSLCKYAEQARLHRDLRLTRFLNSHTCPVCGKLFSDTDTQCVQCGFNEVNRVFINQAEAEQWRENVLMPYIRFYEESKSSAGREE